LGMPTQGVFVAVGHTPSTGILEGVITLDEKKYVKRNEANNVGEEKLSYSTQTDIAGVFVAGDCHDYNYRQAITAAGYGCMAGMDVLKFLDKPVQSW